MLERLGIDRRRFLIDWASAAEGPNFVKIITAFTYKVSELGPLGSCEGKDQKEVQLLLLKAAEAARGRKIRAGLLNASKQMMKEGDFSRKSIGTLVQQKCERALSNFMEEL